MTSTTRSPSSPWKSARCSDKLWDKYVKWEVTDTKDFRKALKLYRRIIHNGDLAAGLPASQEYQLTIQYNYKVTPFKGTKSVILATTSLLGGKNPFLGIAYIVVGCICFLMGILFLFIHLRFGRTTQEMLNIGPQSQYNSN